MDNISLEQSAREILGWSDVDIARSRPMDITNALNRTQQQLTLKPSIGTVSETLDEHVNVPSVRKTNLPNHTKPLQHVQTSHDTDIPSILLNRMNVSKKIAEYEILSGSSSHTVRPMLSLLHCRLGLLNTKLEDIRRDIVLRIEERQRILDIVKSDISDSDIYDGTNNVQTIKDAILADETYITSLSKKLLTIT